MEEIRKLRIVHVVEERRVGNYGVNSAIFDVCCAGIAAGQVNALSIQKRGKVLGNVKVERLRQAINFLGFFSSPSVDCSGAAQRDRQRNPTPGEFAL